MKRVRIASVLLLVCFMLVLVACGQSTGGENTQDTKNSTDSGNNVNSGATKEKDQQTSNYPEKPITYMIPFDPGGQSDIEARRQQPLLEEILGEKVNVTYKPGAGGAVGWTELVGKKPDGYYIAGINIPHIILQPLVKKDTGYKTEQIEPVAIFQSTVFGLAVHKDSGIKTMEDFVNKAKNAPGSMTIAGVGTYSAPHLAILQFEAEADIQLQHIPFTGAATQVKGFLGKDTDAIMANSNDLVNYKDEWTILAIGSPERFKPLPDVPTFIEHGYDMTPGVDRGIAVPPGTSQEVIQTLEKAFLQIANDPDIREKMLKEGFLPRAIGTKESKEFIKNQTPKFKKILEELGELKK